MPVALETIDPAQWARIVALAPWPHESRVTDRYGVAWIKTRGTGRAGGDWTPVDDLTSPGSDTPAGINDGQLMVWSAALGAFLPSNPTGNSELAYAENVTATTQSLAGSAGAFTANTDVTGVSIVVPISARPVYLEAGFQVVQPVAGVGHITIRIQEVGGSNFAAMRSVPLPNTADAHANNFSISIRRRLGATVAARTFKLQFQVGAAAAATPTVVIQNGAFGVIPSYLLAEAA